MRSRLFLTFGVFAAILSSCAPPTPFATSPQSDSATSTSALPAPIQHADAITFALIGDVNLTNAWGYFDERGADYNNHAAQANFWPSLYRLNAESGGFEPYLADGMFTAFQQESLFFTSTVTLRAGLLWSDASQLTAEDVAFSVNTALAFHLGLDWAAAYNPNLLERAEATGPRTVKFFFKFQPALADWQYGALQGPIVNAAYWSPKIESARALLKPRADIENDMLSMQTERTRLQTEMDDLLSQLSTLTPSTQEFNDVQSEINKRQEDIHSIGAHLVEKQEELESIFAAGRAALYVLSDEDEPTLGPFQRAERKPNQIINEINPSYPFSAPNFDRAVYKIFPDIASAFDALKNGQVNLLLTSGGANSTEGVGETRTLNGAGNLRYLAFNLRNPDLAELPLRQVLACLAWNDSESLVLPADGIVPRSNFYWRNTEVSVPCRAARDESERLARAESMLAAAGYRWDVNPAWDGAPVPGLVLRRADGRAVSQLRILAYASEFDSSRAQWAEVIAEKIRHLGIPIQVEQVNAQDVLYRLFDTGDFDMVILGARLARYPAYLCDVFGPGNAFAYETAEMTGHCQLFRAALDLETARAQAHEIQSLLATDLPIVPLYSEAVYDAFSGIAYPFENVLDGFSGMFGAPWLAYPTTP